MKTLQISKEDNTELQEFGDLNVRITDPAWVVVTKQGYITHSYSPNFKQGEIVRIEVI